MEGRPAQGDLAVTTPNGDIAARDFGGTGRPLLLLHGLGENLEYWRAVVPSLTSSWRVLAVDLRGHGLSAGGHDANLEDYVEDLLTVSGELGVGDAVIAGFSLGGYIGLAYAAAGHPCAAFVNIDGPVIAYPEQFARAGLNVGFAEFIAESEAAARKWLFEGAPEELEVFLRDQGIAGGDSEALARRAVQPRADGSMAWKPSLAELIRIQEWLWHFQPSAFYERLDRPSMLIVATEVTDSSPWGEAADEEFANMRRQEAEALSVRHRLRLRLVECGHHIPTEAKDTFAQLLREFSGSL